MGTTEPVTPATDPLRGTRYSSKGILGRGAMGEVHLAEHTSLGKIVVAKLLHRELAGRPDLADRMRIEAQSLARLSHPGLVQVLDYGETPEGRPYLIMERLVGHSLRQEFQQRGAMPFAEAVEITVQMLSGLGAAHEVGLVHRDVKLDNVFVCPQVSGQLVVKVIDFGIAKVLPSAKPGEAPAPLAFPTEDGMTVGTPRFLSPEQARGKPVDARADIYGAGVVLYTLVAGRGPFDHAQGLVELIRAQALEPPTAPSRYAPNGLPPALDMVILKALEKDPDKRFPSTDAFIEALRWSLTADVGAPPPPPPPATPAPRGGYDSHFAQASTQRAPERSPRPHIVPAAGRPAQPSSPDHGASQPPNAPAPEPQAPAPVAYARTVRMDEGTAAAVAAAAPRPRTLQSAQDQARVQGGVPAPVGVAVDAPPRPRTLQSAQPGGPGMGHAQPAQPPQAAAAHAGHAPYPAPPAPAFAPAPAAPAPSPAGPFAPAAASPRAMVQQSPQHAATAPGVARAALTTQRPRRRRRSKGEVAIAVAILIIGVIISITLATLIIRAMR